MKYIATHNTGGTSDPFASTQNVTLSQVDSYHKSRGFNRSSLGYHVGYNFFLPPNGPIVQTRAIGEMTCAAVGHNYDTVHVCFAGNFTRKPDGLPVDTITAQQKLDFLNIVMQLLRKDYRNIAILPSTQLSMDLSLTRILPHRALQKTTECHGSFYPDTFFRDFVVQRVRGEIDILFKLVAAYQQLLLLLQRTAPRSVGAEDMYCEGLIDIDMDEVQGTGSPEVEETPVETAEEVNE
jgi:hypothetical protein